MNQSHDNNILFNLNQDIDLNDMFINYKNITDISLNNDVLEDNDFDSMMIESDNKNLLDNNILNDNYNIRWRIYPGTCYTKELVAPLINIPNRGPNCPETFISQEGQGLGQFGNVNKILSAEGIDVNINKIDICSNISYSNINEEKQYTESFMKMFKYKMDVASNN